MNEYKKVIAYCVRIYEAGRLAAILKFLALDEAKYGSRQYSPHWRMLVDLIDNPYGFKIYCESLIPPEKRNLEEEIINYISQIYSENTRALVKIFHLLLVAEEEKHGCREKSPHWKMLKVLINNKIASQYYLDAFLEKQQS